MAFPALPVGLRRPFVPAADVKATYADGVLEIEVPAPAQELPAPKTVPVEKAEPASDVA